MEVRTDGYIAVVRELAGYLLGRFIPPRHMMDDHHARIWACPQRTSKIRLYIVSIVALYVNGLR